jgi:O-antigen/teichoic acid export membrane protein
MSQVRRIARNTLVIVLGNATAYAFGFFFTMYVARYLGAEGYGVLSFAIGFTAMFGILTDMGLQTLMSRQVARDKTVAQKYVANVGTLKILLNSLTFGLIALVVSFLDYPSETTHIVYLVALSVVFNSFSHMFNGVFRGHERMEYIALGQVMAAAINLGGALFVIHYGHGAIGIAAVYAASTLAVLAFSLTISTFLFVKPRLELDRAFLKKAMGEAWPFALTSFLFSAYYWTDTVVISFMKGDEAVGWYNAAYRLLSVLAFIPMAYFTVIFPVMSRLHISSQELLRFTYERSMKYMLILGLPIGVGTTLLTDRIIAQIFGADFSSSVLVLRILVWSVVLQFASGVVMQLFDSTNRQRTTTLLIGVTVLFNLILDLILTPIYSLYGTAAATLGNAALLFVLGYVLSSRFGYGLSPRILLGTMLRAMLASAAMAFFVIYFQSLSMYILIPVGALIYITVICLVRGFDKEDLELLRQIIRRDGSDAGQSTSA